MSEGAKYILMRRYSAFAFRISGEGYEISRNVSKGTRSVAPKGKKKGR